jgi:ankyrin repeat protein
MEIVRLILEADINVINSTNKLNYSSLHKAVEGGFTLIVDYLLSNHAYVNIFTSDEKATAPIHIACSNGFIDIVELLVKYGSDINVKCVNGDTPILLVNILILICPLFYLKVTLCIFI